MTDSLSEIINQRVAQTLSAEFISKEVDARIDKLVVEAVNSALRSYSDVGKLIEASVKDALKVDRLDLPSYGHTVSMMLKEQIEAKVSGLVAGRLAADMDELLKLAPKEIKLSKIAEDMIEEFKNSNDNAYGPVITVIVETSTYGYSMVYLDETEHREDRQKYECQHRLHVDKEGKIIGATIGGLETKKRQDIGPAYGIDQKLRAYVACGTKIILDEESVQIGVGDY